MRRAQNPTIADGGAPRFCLAYVLPLQCVGPRASSVAIAFLDVHHSLPYMQKQMEARQIADCDLYTFVKFSLLNCLVTDPSVHSDNPALRNPIVFASAGFAAMCGCSQEEVLHRNCRFLQSPQFLEAPPPVVGLDGHVRDSTGVDVEDPREDALERAGAV